MRNLFFIYLAAILLYVSCKKDEDRPWPVITSFTPGKGSFNNIVSIKGVHFDSSLVNTSVKFNQAIATVQYVSDTLIVVRVPQNASTGKIGVTVYGKTTESRDDFIILDGKWILKSDNIAAGFEGRHEHLAFSIGSKAYAGMGFNGGTSLKDFWEYDPANGNWTQKASCGIDFYQGVVMVINGKAYVCLGKSLNLPCCPSDIHVKQVWEYNPVTNTWTRKNDFPGQARGGAFAVGVNNKGYLGMGDIGGGTIIHDWWEYDPLTDIWTQKANNPSSSYSSYPAGFVINNKIYAGLGSYQHVKDWYEYDPSTNVWTRKTDFPGQVDFAASGFVIGSKGYIAGGGPECWEYDPVLDKWTQKAFFDYRVAGGTFSLNGKGYYVAGGYVKKDFWEFTP